jgi:hypothetical protein
MNLRLLFYAFLILIAAVGCDQQTSPVADTLKQADSINIRFSNTTIDNLSTDKNAIQKLANFIGQKEKALPLECEIKPSGIILFYQRGQLLQEVTFTTLSQKCRYFITRLNNQPVYTEVGNEAADFLTAIQQGKSSY